MAVSVDHFGKALVASGLMSADDVKSLWNALPADGRPRDGAAFARLLTEQGKLTEFQAQQILAGKGNLLTFGEYVVIDEIGAGGMGQVYKAQHKRMKRIVALKVMSAAAMKDASSVKRFQREVEAAARLEHPNIVTAFDAGRSGEVNYLVMQFVDGGDLSDMVKKGGPLPVERAVDYVVQAAQGLAFAHGEGVIHRDIKPANLLCDKKGVVKILDMGLARIESNEDGLTATEQVMGTVDYMSPEQASNTKSADARSDIYSLGCTLWYLLTARKTYDGDSMIMRLMQHRDAPLPSLVKARDDVPWPLEQAFHRMIAKRSDERFQTMDEVVAALAPFAGGGAGGNRASPTGAGSSIGMDGGSHNAELSAFMKSVGPTVKTAAKPSPTAGTTAAPVEVTAKFNKAEAETDPKSEMSLAPLDKFAKAIGVAPPAKHPTKPQAKGTVNRDPPGSAFGGAAPPNKALIAAGAGGAALLVLLGLWFIFRNKDGDEIARVQMPEGGSVQVQQPATTGAPPIAVRPAATPMNFFGLPTVGPSPPAMPPGDYALYASHITTPLMIDLAQPITLEAFITPSTKTDLLQTSLFAFNLFTIRGGKTWSLVVWTSQGPKTASSNVAVVPGKRTHVAAVISPAEMRLHIDGKLASRQSLVGSPPSRTPKPLEIGTQFTDLIDEIRVLSDIDRYNKDFTPPERHSPGPNTLLLYHCDEGAGNQLLDASPSKHHGTIESPTWVRADGSPIPPPHVASPNATVPPPPGNYALDFDGISSHVRVDRWRFQGETPLTLEAWAVPAGEGNATVLGDLEYGGISIRSFSGTWEARFHIGNAYESLRAKNRISPRVPVHLAAVFDGKQEYRFYVDGRLQQKHSLPRGFMKSQREFVIGADPAGEAPSIAEPFAGRIDEVRISKVARYDGDFTPQKRFEPDADVMVLYHFDEGYGNVLKDASGNGYDGKIIDGHWAKADSPVVPITNLFGAPAFVATTPPAAPAATPPPVAAEGFTPLFNGKDLSGWSTLAGGPGPWKVVNGAITCDGPLAYLFSDRNDYEDFHLRVEAKVNSAGNGGVYFRCTRDNQRSGHPTGFEAQIVNDPKGDAQKTGSLYNIARISDLLVAPDAWFTLEVMAEGPRIHILINGKQTVDYTDPVRELRRGSIALQNIGLGSTQLAFRKIEIKELPAGAAAIDLLPLVDPAVDTVKGTWQRSGTDLVGQSAAGSHGVIEIPYQPPAEYDLIYEFTRTRGDTDVSVMLTRDGTAFGYCSGQGGTNYGFSRVDGAPAFTNHTLLALVNGRRYRAKVEVRRDVVRGFLDDQLVSELKTDGRTLAPFPSTKLRNDSLLGLTQWQNAAVFHRVQIVEVTGRGKKMRP